MNSDYFRTLFEYDQWAWKRVLEQCARLSDEQYHASGLLDRGSLRDTLLHTLDTQEFWRARCQGRQFEPLHPSDFETLQPLAERWSSSNEVMGNFLAQLSDSDVSKVLRYKSRLGREFLNPLWAMLTQMMNHSMQHRSEIAMVVTRFGHSPGNLDFILFFGERSDPAAS